MTEACKSILNFLGCEYELFENERDGNKVIERWNELIEQGKQEGFYPLFVVPSDTLAETLEFVFDDYDVDKTPESIAAYRQSIIVESKKVDVKSFLLKRLNEYIEMYEDVDILGSFKECEPEHLFYVPFNGQYPHPEIIIAKIMTKNPWELAAWIPMGGFNDCPTPVEQVAVFKYWHEKYGAVPATVTYDNWELELSNPPMTDEGSEELAKEHFAFCFDAIAQTEEGWDTIRARAGALKGSTTWYFWWD